MVDQQAVRDVGSDRVEFFRDSMPRVHGYLLGRCGDRVVADDLLQETLLAAARHVRTNPDVDLNVAWLLTVARNKYVDAVRRAVREERALRRAYDPDETAAVEVDDDVDLRLPGGSSSRERTLTALAAMSPAHRGVLVLHYLDGVPVADVAEEIGRSVHATESLLARARHAFRAHYREEVRAHE